MGSPDDFFPFFQSILKIGQDFTEDQVWQPEPVAAERIHPIVASQFAFLYTHDPSAAGRRPKTGTSIPLDRARVMVKASLAGTSSKGGGLGLRMKRPP